DTGPTGSMASMDNAYIYLSATTTIAANTPIPYDQSNINSPNSLIQYSVGTGVINLIANHLYFVHAISISTSANGNHIGIFRNGSLVPGTDLTTTTATVPQTVPLVASTIINSIGGNVSLEIRAIGGNRDMSPSSNSLTIITLA
ncbi:hypothetical protein, partial [Bacillus toyonensis]|uniref:hypothetical protein n=3 Tax=Bacillus cereus group TaxID=86661 RepID=UPI00159BCB7E